MLCHSWVADSLSEAWLVHTAFSLIKSTGQQMLARFVAAPRGKVALLFRDAQIDMGAVGRQLAMNARLVAAERQFPFWPRR